MMSQITFYCAYHIVIFILLSFNWNSWKSNCALVDHFQIEDTKSRFKAVFDLEEDEEHDYSGFDYIHDYMLALYNRHVDHWPGNLEININDDLKYIGKIDQIKSHLPINTSAEKSLVHRFNLTWIARDQKHAHIASEFRIRLEDWQHRNVSISVTLQDVSDHYSAVNDNDLNYESFKTDFIQFRNVNSKTLKDNWFSFDVSNFINKLLHVKKHLAVFHLYVEEISPYNYTKNLLNRRSIYHAPITRKTAKFQSHLVTYLRQKKHQRYSTTEKIIDDNQPTQNDKRKPLMPQKLKRNKRSVEDETKFKRRIDSSTAMHVLRRKKRRIRHQRSNRASYDNHYRKMILNMCQRRSLYVDFAKIEWSQWIFAPAGYEAGFCSGECPFPLGHHFNSTNHAIIQLLMHTKHPRRVPRPCCVPNEYASQPMLIFYNGAAIVKRLGQMVVLSCSCQ